MPISVSGLDFFDNTEDIPYNDREGKPDILFGIEKAPHHLPLHFRYEATDAVSTFSLVKIDIDYNIISTTALTTSLIASDSTYHTCSGTVEYSVAIELGIYYFLVNDRYQSQIFQAIAIAQGVEYDIIEENLIVY